MASFSRQSALPCGWPSAKPWKNPGEGCSGFSPENTSTVLPHGAIRSGECRGDRAGPGIAALAGAHPLGRPGDPGFCCPDKACPPISPQPGLQPRPTMAARELRGLPRSGARAAGHLAAPGAANQGRRETGAQHHPHQTRLSLGGFGVCSVSPHRWARLPPDCRCSRPCRPREGARGSAGPRERPCRITKQAWRGPPGLEGVPSPGPGRRSGASPRADCRVSPAGRGGGDWPAAAPTSWRSRRPPPTPAATPGPRGVKLWRLQGLANSQFHLEKRSASQLSEHGTASRWERAIPLAPLRATAAPWAAASAWLAGRSVHQ